MKKLFCTVLALLVLTVPALAADYTVERGDTMWKIAAKYHVGTDEIIAANPQVRNPDRIYPGQRLTIPTVDKGTASFEEEVVRLVNAERAKAGLRPLTMNWELSRVARYKSEDMRQKHYFDHTSPTYGSPFDMMRSFGITYRAAGENIAMGYSTPAAVVNAWMNSSGHRANILSAKYTEIGVGYVSNGNYWTQMFIG